MRALVEQTLAEEPAEVCAFRENGLSRKTNNSDPLLLLCADSDGDNFDQVVDDKDCEESR